MALPNFGRPAKKSYGSGLIPIEEIGSGKRLRRAVWSGALNGNGKRLALKPGSQPDLEGGSVCFEHPWP
jgi:hypothetical protein